MKEEVLKKKTIFITITRGLLLRNVLRMGGYELLRKAGFRIVILLQTKTMPPHLHEEFGDDTVICQLDDSPFGHLHRVIFSITNFLIFTDSTVRYLKYGNMRLIERNRILTNAHIFFVWLLSKMWFLKPLVRKLDPFFDESNDQIRAVFDTYTPDIVFGTSISSKFDVSVMKEARRRGITTVGMPKGWDNSARNYFRFIPDFVLVQNEILRDSLVMFQDIPEHITTVVGFPQFDLFKKPGVIRSREDHLKKMGLDPALPYIFFGSEGAWTDKDYEIAEEIYQWILKDELGRPSQLLVRPHFTNIFTHQFGRFKGRPKVVFDETITSAPFFPDNWDPSFSDTVELVNTIAHCDVLVTLASTLNLDAASFDKPIINVAYGAKFRGREDITPFLFDAVHMQWIEKTEGTDIVYNPDELKVALTKALHDPGIRSAGRRKMRDELCYRIDGASSNRMVDALVEMSTKK